MKKKTIYRTVIEVEVLSENPIGEADMETIVTQTMDGDWSGKNVTKIQDQKLTGKKAVKAIENQGSDTEFFNMDENGNEIDL